jgi:hypothetical protein
LLLNENKGSADDIMFGHTTIKVVHTVWENNGFHARWHVQLTSGWTARQYKAPCSLDKGSAKSQQ